MLYLLVATERSKNWAGLKQDLNVSHFTDGALVFTFQFSIRTNVQVNIHILNTIRIA